MSKTLFLLCDAISDLIRKEEPAYNKV